LDPQDHWKLITAAKSKIFPSPLQYTSNMEQVMEAVAFTHPNFAFV